MYEYTKCRIKREYMTIKLIALEDEMKFNLVLYRHMYTHVLFTRIRVRIVCMRYYLLCRCGEGTRFFMVIFEF